MKEPRLSAVHYGRERCDAGDLPRHRHAEGYLTLVLSGSYLEAGDAGRFGVREGDVLIHRRFEAHQDRFGGRASDVLNLPLPPATPAAAMIRVDDPDAVVRLAEFDPAAAAALVCSTGLQAEPATDWPDLLAAELRRVDSPAIAEWADRHGLSPSAVSRGFRQAFGITAVRYRAEARTRLAYERICGSAQPLAYLALDLGFADQAHMTRSLRTITGLPPGRWRTQIDSRR